MFQSDFCVKTYTTREEMGIAAAEEFASVVKDLLDKKETVVVVFAAAPSQNDMLKALAQHSEIDFTRVIALHMDEYVGLSEDAPQRFGHYLDEHIFHLVPFREIHYIHGFTSDIEAECARYTALFNENKPDIVCMGIGENGHIAFNDPHVADFNDPAIIKKVELDEICRMQQVHDGCFATINEVPTHALTLTIPALMSAKYHICVVPTSAKADAVYNTVMGPIGEAVPATALRLAPHATMFLDKESALKLDE